MFIYCFDISFQILKRSLKHSKVQKDEHDEFAEGDQVALYGKWQTETLSLPRAVDGIVPKVKKPLYFINITIDEHHRLLIFSLIHNFGGPL